MNITILGDHTELLEQRVLDAIYDKGSNSEVYKAAKNDSLVLITKKFFEDLNSDKDESSQSEKMNNFTSALNKASLIITPSVNTYLSTFDMGYHLRTKTGPTGYVYENNMYLVDYSVITNPEIVTPDHFVINNTFKFDPSDIRDRYKNIKKPVEVLSLRTVYKKNKTLIITSEDINESTNIYHLLF